MPTTNDPVFEAITQGDVAALGTLLDNGASPDAVEEWTETVPTGRVVFATMVTRTRRRTALETACALGQSGAARLLLERGARATGPALWQAVDHCDLFLAEMLLKRGADPNYAEALPFIREERDEPYSPTEFEVVDQYHDERMVLVLERAGEKRRADLVRVLLKKGARPGKFADEVFLAAAFPGGDAEMFRTLLRMATPSVLRLYDSITNVTRRGDLESAEVLLAVAPARRAWGGPMRAAIEGNHPALFEALIRAGAEADDDNLRTAARWGRLWALERLLAMPSISIDAVSGNEPFYESQYTTALMQAAYWGHIAAVRLLLDHGADLSRATAGGGKTAMILAARGGQEDVVRLLLQRGAGKTEEELLRAFHEAALGLSTDCMVLLLSWGARPTLEQLDQTLLTLVFEVGGRSQGFYDYAVERLLELGADPTATNERGSVLEIAATYGRSNMLKQISRRIPERQRPLALARALRAALNAEKPGDSVRTLLEDCGADPNVLVDGRPLLWEASLFGAVEKMSLLLEYGADPKLVTPDKRTPLHEVAAIHQHYYWKTPERLRVGLALLCASGADVNAGDAQGRTPLMELAGKPRTNEPERSMAQMAVELLIRQGSDWSVRDAAGERAYDLAQRAGNGDLLPYLR